MSQVTLPPQSTLPPRSELPPQTQGGAGFERPSVRQFTVFMENKVGRLQQLVRSYENAGGVIVALSVQDSADTALIRVIYADADLARSVLQGEGFAFSEHEVLAVELPKGARHGLTAICNSLLAAEINIHYTYPLMLRPGGPAVVLYVDDSVLACELLMRKGHVLLGESDLKKLIGR